MCSVSHEAFRCRDIRVMSVMHSGEASITWQWRLLIHANVPCIWTISFVLSGFPPLTWKVWELIWSPEVRKFCWWSGKNDVYCPSCVTVVYFYGCNKTVMERSQKPTEHCLKLALAPQMCLRFMLNASLCARYKFLYYYYYIVIIIRNNAEHNRGSWGNFSFEIEWELWLCECKIS